MDIKEDWRNLRLEAEASTRLNEIMSGRRQTALEKLKGSYRRFAIVGFVMILATGCMTIGGTLERLAGSGMIWFGVVWCMYFATCAVMDTWLYHGISKIDIYSMPVNQVSEMAIYYRKRHLQFIAILLPWALGIVGFFLYLVSDNIYMVGAICVGFVAGLAIGITKLMEFMSYYRNLRE